MSYHLGGMSTGSMDRAYWCDVYPALVSVIGHYGRGTKPKKRTIQLDRTLFRVGRMDSL